MILIEKDKAIKETWEEPSYSDPLNVLTEVRDRIKALPTIEIVQCRECRHWDASKNCGYCDIWDHYISNEDFYCGCGDRRNEDG